MACRSSPEPIIWTEVTLPYFLYSWNSPSRTLELLDLTGKPCINMPTGFLSRLLDVAGSLVTVESLAVPCDELPGDDRAVPLGPRLSRSCPRSRSTTGAPSPWLPHNTTNTNCSSSLVTYWLADKFQTVYTHLQSFACRSPKIPHRFTAPP